MTRVLLLHGYNALNLGDGLLVRESMSVIREALGDCHITVAASHPETFSGLDAEVLNSGITWRGYSRTYTRVLRRIRDFDLVVGVGGGYLRAGTVVEALKCALVHGPQLVAAARTSVPTIYLPQSIGPFHFGTRRIVQRLLSSMDKVMLRDDRSLNEFPAACRTPDLATMGRSPSMPLTGAPHEVPVLSVRSVKGTVPKNLYQLATLLGFYDCYIQSTSASNDDRPATSTFRPRRILHDEVLAPSEPRVIVAVRLHAALMALAAGHYVVHLAYERKGFGAFSDLGLSEFVHNVNTFDPVEVVQQVRRLMSDPDARRAYSRSLEQTTFRRSEARESIVQTLRAAAVTKTTTSTTNDLNER